MRTVTYDETQWKLMPLYIEENQVDKGVMGYLGCTADELKKIDPEQLTRCEQLIINAYVDCLDAAPLYPEDSPEHDMRNYGQSWSVKTFDNGTVKTKHIPLPDILLPLLASPKEPE